MNDQQESYAAVPMQVVGPVKITGPVLDEEVMVPLATFETPLWPSVGRGARVSVHSGGIRVVVAGNCMTRSVLLEAPTAQEAVEAAENLETRLDDLKQIAARESKHTKLKDLHTEIVGNLLYIRFSMNTGDAAGHNMVTAAADRLISWILEQYPPLRYVSISGNFCTDKKASAVNGILGRGKHVITEITVPQKICSRYLKTTPEKIVELNIKKNLIGTMLAGSIRTANAHYANMLLAFYLATGQDAANIVEGSQGIVHAEVKDGDLYFSATIPNIIVGTVGSGKKHPFVRENLDLMGCQAADRDSGENAKRLAAIAGATVLCGELSLLAAQTNQGELMKAHIELERS